MKKPPKADPFATIDTGALANVTGGYVAGAGGQMPPYQGGSGSGSGSSSGHHHHHGGCGGNNGNNNGGNNNGGSVGGTANPIQLSWGTPSGESSIAQVLNTKNTGRYY